MKYNSIVNRDVVNLTSMYILTDFDAISLWLFCVMYTQLHVAPPIIYLDAQIRGTRNLHGNPRIQFWASGQAGQHTTSNIALPVM